MREGQVLIGGQGHVLRHHEHVQPNGPKVVFDGVDACRAFRMARAHVVRQAVRV